MGTKHFSYPQALSSGLAVARVPQLRTFGLLKRAVPLPNLYLESGEGSEPVDLESALEYPTPVGQVDLKSSPPAPEGQQVSALESEQVDLEPGLESPAPEGQQVSAVESLAPEGQQVSALETDQVSLVRSRQHLMVINSTWSRVRTLAHKTEARVK